MIMPARWYAGGRGLDEFRSEMLTDNTIQVLHDYPKASDLFNNVEIKGGLCYFLMNSNYDNSKNLVTITTHSVEGGIYTSKRLLSSANSEIFVRDGRSITILSKVNCSSDNLQESWVSPLKPFGLRGYFINDEKFRESADGLSNPVSCVAKGLKVGYVEREIIPLHKEWIDAFKVIMPRANNIGTEANDDNLNVFTAPPGMICTESYLCIGANHSLSKNQCDNMCKYLKGRFARYLHSVAKASQDATSKTFKFVPLQDFTANSDIDWSQSVANIDRQLYAKYNLTEEEITFIESMIKPM